jgi:hypothetical protein
MKRVRWDVYCIPQWDDAAGTSRTWQVVHKTVMNVRIVDIDNIVAGGV